MMCSKHHPESILVTPPGSSVLVSERAIQLPSLSICERVPYEAARISVGQKGCLWNPRMGDILGSWRPKRASDTLDVAQGHRVRIGVGVALFLNGCKFPVMIRSSDNHPTRPGEWGCPRGVLEEARTAHDVELCAVAELCEELVPVCGEVVQRWVFEGSTLTHPWQERLCSEWGCYLGDALFSLGRRSAPGVRAVMFGPSTSREGAVMAFADFESETGSLELLFPMEATVPPDVFLYDGEMDTASGKLLNRPIFDPRRVSTTTFSIQGVRHLYC